ncbi:MAG: ferritin-like domain-containing protein [Proteobacteria bacterium]|nr:ferritin-like domain-containing protein [Pseudomonadota bacterium]
MPRQGYPGGAAWSVDDIPYGGLVRTAVRDDAQLFYTLATASFVEITSDLYTRNLIEFFRGDAEVETWLARGWEPEELQHGAALRRYVETAWPDFDWVDGYRRFMAEFTQFCSVDQLAPTRTLEMAARCVVETGTASFYRMLSEISPEPVLRTLTARIRADEVRHYKHFYRYYLRYRALERPGRRAVLSTLWHRVGEVDAEDAFYAFKHVYLATHPGAAFERKDYVAFRTGFRRLAQRHFPYAMAVKMLLKPLGLSGPVGRVVLPAATAATRLLLLR